MRISIIDRSVKKGTGKNITHTLIIGFKPDTTEKLVFQQKVKPQYRARLVCRGPIDPQKAVREMFQRFSEWKKTKNGREWTIYLNSQANGASTFIKPLNGAKVPEVKEEKPPVAEKEKEEETAQEETSPKAPHVDPIPLEDEEESEDAVTFEKEDGEETEESEDEDEPDPQPEKRTPQVDADGDVF